MVKIVLPLWSLVAVSQVLQYNGSKSVMLTSQQQSLSGLVETGKLENVSRVECKTFDPRGKER